MSTVDFRSKQIQTHKIIANEDRATNSKIVVYGINADGSPINNGNIDPAVFPEYTTIGTDVFLYVSGAKNNRQSADVSVAAFGGDVVVSGAFYQGQPSDVKGGDYSHAEGFDTTASNNYSHAEGYSTTASGQASHAEGYSTTANGAYSHAEGNSTESSGNYSHAEGNNTESSGNYSHAEGNGTTAVGDYSHAGGIGTEAYAQGQTVFGQYNLTSNNTSSFVVGAGSDNINRADLFAVDGVLESAHLVLSGGIRHHAIFTTEGASSPPTPYTTANLTKRNYMVISDTNSGNKLIELPRITDPIKDIGLTVVIKQYQVIINNYTVTITINSFNAATFQISVGGFQIGTDIILNGDNTATSGPDYTGRKNMSMTLTYMGDMLGSSTPLWVVMNVSDT